MFDELFALVTILLLGQQEECWKMFVLQECVGICLLDSCMSPKIWGR
jgi:hypothetical protein